MKIDIKDNQMTIQDLKVGDVFSYVYEEKNYRYHIHYAMKIQPYKDDERGLIYNAIDLNTSKIESISENKKVYYWENARLAID